MPKVQRENPQSPHAEPIRGTQRKVIAHYRPIFLVAYHESKNSEHRVTDRGPGVQRPGTIKFVGSCASTDPNATFGTLVLTEAKWEEWFAGRHFMPGMTTAAEAAETLVSGQLGTSVGSREAGPPVNRGPANIFYGCPICSYKGKDREEVAEHIRTHVAKFLTQFELEIVDD